MNLRAFVSLHKKALPLMGRLSPLFLTSLLLSILSLHCHFALPALIVGYRHFFPSSSTHGHGGSPSPGTTSTCDFFTGSWYADQATPFYDSSCPIIDAGFNCSRPDSDYLKFLWKPTGCTLQRFEAKKFLQGMRERTVMFVGDSLGRNQWESLVCMLYSEDSQLETQMVMGEPLSTFKFLDFGVTLCYFKAPYLVDIDVIDGGKKRVLKLKDISTNSKEWEAADMLVFNTGHWWTHIGTLKGWDAIEYRGGYVDDMDRLTALEEGLVTWSKWVDMRIDVAKTMVFMVSISPAHYYVSMRDEGGGGGRVTKSCKGEREPLKEATIPEAYRDQMRVMENVVRGMRNHVNVLNVTMLSELRIDAHPSVYSGKVDLEPGINSPEPAADCSHWCLPGLPDTWNHLLYNLLLLQYY